LVESGTSQNNIAMQKMAEKLHMKHEGTRRQAVYENGGYVDVLEYGLLKGKFNRYFG